MATQEKIEAYIRQLYDNQEERVRNVLDRITDENRNLLALRGYVRFPSRITNRWAWTNQEEEEFRGSREGAVMAGEIQSILRRFARNNPGHRLRANQQARSLDQQINSWINQRSRGGRIVLSFGQRLWNLAGSELDRTNQGTVIYPDLPTADSTVTFHDWLRQHSRDLGLGHRVEGRWRTNPSLATPGLSDHGRLRAIDFSVIRRGTTVAGADSGQDSLDIWRGNPHWQTLLNDAITAGGGNWEGPLRNPDEPWHYTYTA